MSLKYAHRKNVLTPRFCCKTMNYCSSTFLVPHFLNSASAWIKSRICRSKKSRSHPGSVRTGWTSSRTESRGTGIWPSEDPGKATLFVEAWKLCCDLQNCAKLTVRFFRSMTIGAPILSYYYLVPSTYYLVPNTYYLSLFFALFQRVHHRLQQEQPEAGHGEAAKASPARSSPQASRRRKELGRYQG